MDRGALGARNQRAQERILAAAAILAERFDLGEQGLMVQQRDREVKAMMERERVADLLEALVGASKPRRSRGKQAADAEDAEE